MQTNLILTHTACITHRLTLCSFYKGHYQGSKNLSDLIWALQGVVVSETKLKPGDSGPKACALCVVPLCVSAMWILLPSLSVWLHSFRVAIMYNSEYRVPAHSDNLYGIFSKN